MKLLLRRFRREAFSSVSASEGQREKSIKNAGQEWVTQCETKLESVGSVA